LLFLLVLGFQWTIGIHIISYLFDTMPPILSDGWKETDEDVRNGIKTMFVWALPILLLYVSIRVLSMSSDRGYD